MQFKNFLCILIAVLFFVLLIYILNKTNILDEASKENSENILIDENIIDFNSLTLKQKISQMIIIRGDYEDNIKVTNLNVGGIFLSKQNSKEEYKSLISDYNNRSKIKLFITTDMEGAWNPFIKFKEFKSFSNINNSIEAFNIGLLQGEFLKEMGFNLNFAPVAEFKDDAYGGRVFLGSKKEVEEKIKSYILGLQKNIYGTCKHYPGKGMIKNTHLRKDEEIIEKEDLELFQICFENNISFNMVGHQIVSGELNSNERPSSVSGEVIDSLPDEVLVISDEVNMLGLRNFYINKEDMYKDLINSGENLILDFNLDFSSFYILITNLEKMVKNGEISEDKINKSVKKILMMKGYETR